MSVIERFTRDQASKFVWAAMALAAALGLVYAIVGAGRAVEVERANSHARAVRYVQDVLDPRLDTRELASPFTGTSSESLARVVRRSILADERVSRVRIWSTDGTLLFSTDPSDHRGSDEGLNDPVLRDASREGPLTRTDLSDGGGADDPERTLLRTYVPLGTASVAEIDQTDAGTVAAARTAWFYYQLLAGGVLLLLLVMTAISLRDPFEAINTGVPFAASSVPPGFSLIDDDRLAAVEEVYRLASERVARVQEKLDESEEARRGLESYIQQTLSRIESAEVPPPAVSGASVSSGTAPPATEPTVVHVPESDVVSASLDAWATAPAGPLARASRAQKPTPTRSRDEGPVAEKPKRTLKRPRVKPERPAAGPQEVAAQPPAAEPEPSVAAMAAAAPAPAPTKRPAAPAPAPAKRPAASAPATPKARKEARAGPVSESSVPAAPSAEVPRGEPTRKRRTPARAVKRTAAPSPPDPDVDDAKAHAAALETFIRLTESDRQHHEMNTADQSEIRAALARTAARKKPGGDRLQPHEGPPEESLGGPPNGRR